MKNFISIFISILIFFIQGNSAYAQEVLFFDNFDGGLEKWEINKGDIYDFVILNQSLEARIDQPFSVSEILPRDEFWINSKKLSISFTYVSLEGQDKNFSFNVIDSDNWYEFHFNQSGLEVAGVVDGKVTWRDRASFILNNNIEYQIEMILIEDHFRLLIDNQQIISTKNSEFLDAYGKIGIKVGTGASFPSHIIVDNILVTDLSTASFPHFFQTDPAWANKEYDSAANWSPEDSSIARWGCALSSLAMILRSHGINYLSDGTEIDPASLNTWLLSQPDGYLQHGLVNFAAVMRLSRELHDSYGTPKLEYVRENSPDLTTAIQQVTDKKPVVLQIPGHFLVGYDTTDQFDLKIKDPAYPYSQFSEHETHLVSTRTFTPSNTDLSFLVLTHPPELDISLKLPDGSIVTSQEDFIHSTETTSTSPPLAVSEFAKPATGTYTVSISSEDLSVHDFSLYTYDQLGNPTIHTQTVSSGPASTTYELTYHKDGRSTLSPVLEVSTILENLGTLREKGHIRKQYAYLLFSHLFSQLDSLPAQELPKHTSYLRFLVEWFSLGISDEGNAFLLNQISEIERSFEN